MGHDEAVIAWVSTQTAMRFRPPYVAFGNVDADGRMLGAVVWTDFYRGGNIEVTVVGHRWGRDFIRECFRYAFVTNNCSRITARTRRSNTAARRLLPKLGFSFEFTQKRFFGPERADDGLVFVMFREQAGKWLHG